MKKESEKELEKELDGIISLLKEIDNVEFMIFLKKTILAFKKKWGI